MSLLPGRYAPEKDGEDQAESIFTAVVFPSGRKLSSLLPFKSRLSSTMIFPSPEVFFMQSIAISIALAGGIFSPSEILFKNSHGIFALIPEGTTSQEGIPASNSTLFPFTIAETGLAIPFKSLNPMQISALEMSRSFSFTWSLKFAKFAFSLRAEL